MVSILTHNSINDYIELLSVQHPPVAIKPSKYNQIDTEAVAQQQSHLSVTQCAGLAQVLAKYKKLFSTDSNVKAFSKMFEL